ncbi:MAG: hypothetical protein PVH29_12075 [Candidatus Zixiibacteriota bacterium]|jgi:hypothetical protein
MEYRVQVLARQSDLNFDGDITRVEYHGAETASGATYGEFEMRLSHTPLSALTENFADNYGGRTPAVVATANPLVLNTVIDEWFAIDCSPAFPYNNADNLIVEVHWRNTAEGISLPVWGYDGGAYLMMYALEYNGTTGLVSTKTNRLRITYEANAVAPTSLGRVRALFR